jgi:hypothetical protein
MNIYIYIYIYIYMYVCKNEMYVHDRIHVTVEPKK